MAPLPIILVFTRQYDAGPVKTRLAAEIGQEEARRAYRRMAERVWSGLEHPGLRRWLCVEPAWAVLRAALWLPGAERVVGQPLGDLGTRLSAAFAAAFRDGAPWVAAVGTDAPDVDAERVLIAGRALRGADAVTIPSLDGGYALLALKQHHPWLFSSIPWSTSRVLYSTRERAMLLGLQWRELEPVRDIDTLADLRAMGEFFE